MISRSCNPRVISSYYVNLKALLLTEGVIVATCLSTFVGARQLAPEPSASSASALSSSSLCSRALATTLWGAAFSFFSLMADAWPAAKAYGSVSSDASSDFFFLDRLIYFLLLAPVTPTYYRAIHDVLVIFFGINQPRGFLKRTRLVANTEIVLGMSDSTKIPPTHIDTDCSPVKEDNVADALTLGHKTAENSCLMVLSTAGKLALLESSDILPDYKQLRFLDGKSGIATLIIGVQAFGYVTSIVYRAIQHLPVSPIEAIGFAFSMLVIVHSGVHSLGVLSQSALVIYLNPTQEQEMLHKCGTTRWSNVDVEFCNNAAIVGMVVVASVVVAFTLFVECPVLTISSLDAIGPILFFISLITQLFLIGEHFSENSAILLFFWNVTISFGGIAVSIVATILNWQSDKFDSRTPSVIHNLPFLG